MLKIDFIDFGTHESQTGFRRDAKLAKPTCAHRQHRSGAASFLSPFGAQPPIFATALQSRVPKIC
jgi:hypothetical protein